MVVNYGLSASSFCIATACIVAWKPFHRLLGDATVYLPEARFCFEGPCQGKLALASQPSDGASLYLYSPYSSVCLLVLCPPSRSTLKGATLTTAIVTRV